MAARVPMTYRLFPRKRTPRPSISEGGRGGLTDPRALPERLIVDPRLGSGRGAPGRPQPAPDSPRRVTAPRNRDPHRLFPSKRTPRPSVAAGTATPGAGAPGTEQRHSGTVAARGPSGCYSREELVRLSDGLVEAIALFHCPRCDVPMTAARPSRGFNHVHLATRCRQCGQSTSIDVRSGRDIRVPAFDDNLVLSAPRRGGQGTKVSGTAVSAVVHGVLITGAVLATAHAVDVVPDVVADTTMVFFAEERDPEPDRATEQRPAVPQLVNLAPPKGFQTIDAPIDVPTSVPDIDLTQRFDPRDFSGVGVERGVFTGVEGGKLDLSQQIFEATAVDEPPERISGPPLVYPAHLKRDLIEGLVRVEFVIDTTGVPVPDSFKVLDATHPDFIPPARTVILGSRFRPGRVRGRAVPVLVGMPVTFSINR